MVDIVLKGLLLLSPLVYSQLTPMVGVDLYFFRFGTIILFAAALLDKPVRSLDKELAISLAALLALSVYNVFIHKFSQAVITSSFTVLQAVMAFAIIFTYCKEPKRCFSWICWGAFINIAVYLMQVAGINLIFNDVETPGGMMGNNTRLATYLALVCPFMARRFWWVGLLFVFAIGFMARQTTVFLSLAIVAFYLLKDAKQKILFTVLFVLFAVLIRDKVMHALSFRWEMAWMPVLVTYFKQPFLGYGLGVWPQAIKTSDVAASSLLQFILGAGLLGVVWFAYTAKFLWRGVLKRGIENAALVSLFSLMLYEYPLEMIRLWFSILAIIAFYAINKREGGDVGYQIGLQR